MSDLLENVDFKFPLRGLWTPRRLTTLISSMQDDIEWSQAQIKDSKESLEVVADSKKDVQKYSDAYIENPWTSTPNEGFYNAAGEPDFSAMRDKIDELAGRLERLIRSHEVVMEDRRKAIAQAKEMLRQLQG